MTSNQILALGAVAGSTILPAAGRVRSPNLRLKATLSATATGILLLLLYDVIHGGIEPVPGALELGRRGRPWSEHRLVALPLHPTVVVDEAHQAEGGPAAKRKVSKAKRPQLPLSPVRALRRLALGLGVAIPPDATGIGIHNFSEGLAIGQSFSMCCSSATMSRRTATGRSWAS